MNGDYQIPDLKLTEQPEKPLGKYGSCLLYTSRHLYLYGEMCGRCGEYGLPGVCHQYERLHG